MDLELTVEQHEIVDLFSSVADRCGALATLRDHEHLGFDRELWDQLVTVGAPGMGVPEAVGGGGSDLLDVALAVEALATRLAPVPFVEHAVAARLLARLGGVGADVVDAIVEGTTIATVAVRPADARHQVRLVPAGAIAHAVLALDHDELVLITAAPTETAVPNLASAPLADRPLTGASITTRDVLARGDDAVREFERAVDEWRALTAAALVGVGHGALALGRSYVSERRQFGVPIGSFQAIQHSLADVSVMLDGAQLLARKAAWGFDGNRADASTLAGYAFLFAAEQAQRASERVLHFHGGYGFMQEYDIQLYYRRAKGWPLVLGPPAGEYARLAASRYGPLPTSVAS